MSLALAHQGKTNKARYRKTSTSAKHPSTHHRINYLNRDSPGSLLQLQRTMGNQAVLRLMRSNVEEGFDFAKIGNIQPKLKVSQPGDEYEQEADRVAKQVMGISVPNNTISSSASNNEEHIARKCSACETKEEEEKSLNIHRKPSSNSLDLEAPHEIINQIYDIHASGSGSPLDSSTKEFMESRFDYDFSRVKIYTDEKAVSSFDQCISIYY
jgi:hypothetical protein